MHLKEFKEQLDKEDRTLSDFTKVTARGDKVVSISKDGNGRDIAIIDRTAMQEKLGVCLDTCHVSDAGYDIAGNLEAVLEEFDRVIGLPRLRALHLNDSKNPLASHKDRHERLGEGYLGIETFYHIIEHPALRGLPMILETPNELPGYAAEIARLRAYDAANANKL